MNGPYVFTALVRAEAKDMDGASRRRAAPGSQIGEHVVDSTLSAPSATARRPASLRGALQAKSTFSSRNRAHCCAMPQAMHTVHRAQEARPNPSFEPTPNGIALGPRGALLHHAPRGPSTMPPVAAQLQR
jgi:hypothetical protein